LLDSLVVVAPDWLRPMCQPAWHERHARRVEEARLPQGQAACEVLVGAIGGGGHALLDALYTPTAPA